MKADLAIFSHVLGMSGQCLSVALMLGNKMDLSSCAIWTGFHKSSHIYTNFYILFTAFFRICRFQLDKTTSMVNCFI